MTYQELGFTLTPRAAHEDRMGTSNRLVRTVWRENFIELLEVDRPDRLARHNSCGVASVLQLGDHNRLAVREREGLSMLVFAATHEKAASAAFRPLISPPLRRSTSSEAPASDGAQPRRFAFSLCLRAVPGHAEGGILRLPRIERGTIFGRLNTNRTPTVPLALQRFISPPRLLSAMQHLSARCLVEKSGPIPGGCSRGVRRSQELRVLTPEAIAGRDR